MKITLTHIKNLLKLFENGLTNGAGHGVNHFCVQQAVHRVIDNDLDKQKSDHPPTWCVNDQVVGFGIHLNDAEGWFDEQARAKGLQRFAIAELGSEQINGGEFYKRLAKKLADRVDMEPDEFCYDSGIIDDWMMSQVRKGLSNNQWLTILANDAADVLMDLGSEGSIPLSPDEQIQRREM
jgi:hypothetical protein